MNTHQNLAPERQLKLAETLKSFSLEPVSQDSEPPKNRTRRLFLAVCLFALISGCAIGALLYRPDGVRHIGSMLAALPDPANTVADRDFAIDGTKPGEGTGKAAQARIPGPVADQEITGSGFVVAPRMTTVFSKYEGRITHVAVDAGDAVEAGQVLVTLDDAAAHFDLEQARATRDAAELVLAARMIDLAQSRTTLDRTEILAAGDAVSRQTLEEERTSLELASNAVAQARQSLSEDEISIRIAEEGLAELIVRAPFAGTVTRLDARVGDTVLARVDSVRDSQSLLTITDTSRLMIDADVSETNIAALKPGLRGEAVLDGFPDQPFTVEVLRLAPVASAEKGTITLRLSLDSPPEGIRPNMAARIRIPLDHTGDMIP